MRQPLSRLFYSTGEQARGRSSMRTILWGAVIQWRRHGDRKGTESSDEVDHLILLMLRYASLCWTFLSRMVSCQASPCVGGLPLLGKEGHGLVRRAKALARHPLMQCHPLRQREREREDHEAKVNNLVCLWKTDLSERLVSGTNCRVWLKLQKLFSTLEKKCNWDVAHMKTIKFSLLMHMFWSISTFTHHAVPGRNDEFLLLVTSGFALLIVTLYSKTGPSHVSENLLATVT